MHYQVNIYSITKVHLSAPGTVVTVVTTGNVTVVTAVHTTVAVDTLLLLLSCLLSVTHRGVLLGGVLELELGASLGLHGDAQLERGGHGRLLLQLLQTHG